MAGGAFVASVGWTPGKGCGIEFGGIIAVTVAVNVETLLGTVNRSCTVFGLQCAAADSGGQININKGVHVLGNINRVTVSATELVGSSAGSIGRVSVIDECIRALIKQG